MSRNLIRGLSMLVRVTERDVGLMAAEHNGEPKWVCPQCRRWQFSGFIQPGRHIAIICMKSDCKATLRFEVVPDPTPIDLTVPIGRHRKPVAEPRAA